MPIKTISGSKAAHLSYSYRLQDALADLVAKEKITIPEKLKGDLLVVTLNDPQALSEKVDVFLVAKDHEHTTLIDQPPKTVLGLIRAIYNKENVEVDGDKLTITSPEAAGVSDGLKFATCYTEFHNARFDRGQGHAAGASS